jgi:hypothetical protein
MLAACNQHFQSIDTSGNNQVSVNNTENSVRDSIVVVSECNCELYTSVLEEDTLKDSSAFVLTIKNSDGTIKKRSILDVRPRMSGIDYCNDYYTVIGFPCGGPCYSQVFVFTQNNRPDEQFSYSQRIYNMPELIAYIRNEEFENLIVHNFNNGKELIIDISDNNWLNFGQMDSMYMNQNDLIMLYTDKDEAARTKSVNLEVILK